MKLGIQDVDDEESGEEGSPAHKAREKLRRQKEDVKLWVELRIAQAQEEARCAEIGHLKAQEPLGRSNTACMKKTLRETLLELQAAGPSSVKIAGRRSAVTRTIA